MQYALGVVVVVLSALPLSAAEAPPAAAGGPGTVVTFDQEAAGQPPSSFEPVVGDWSVAELAGAHGLMVDGSRWRQGTPSANLADQARRLYGERYAEFLDGVKAYAYFPLAVYKGDCPSGDLMLSVRSPRPAAGTSLPRSTARTGDERHERVRTQPADISVKGIHAYAMTTSAVLCIPSTTNG